MSEDSEDEVRKLKIITPEQYIFEEIPRRYPEAKEPEPIPIFGLIKWTGHTHRSDLDALAEALSRFYAFKRVEPNVGDEDLFEIDQVLECTLEGSEARFEGMHPIGELIFETGLVDLNSVQNWERIIKEFREERKDAKATLFYAKYPTWYVGYCTEHKRFFESRYGTVYFEQKGNRDIYKISIEVPPSMWVWDMYPAEKSKHVHRVLADMQKHLDISSLHVHDVYGKDVLEKKQLFRATIEIEMMDIDFKDYKGPESVLTMAEEVSNFLKRRRLRVGGTEEAFFILRKKHKKRAYPPKLLKE